MFAIYVLLYNPIPFDQILIVILSFNIGYEIGNKSFELNTGFWLLLKDFVTCTHPLTRAETKGFQVQLSHNAIFSAFEQTIVI